jgi:N,N'-diacetyllegionaminate synthase
MATSPNAQRVQVIAEIGSVHDGSFGNAQKLIELAAQVGADVAKFQTHIAAAETLRNAPMPPYFKGEPRYEYFERTGFREDQWAVLKAHCEAQGIGFISSPFSIEAVHLLEKLGMSVYKIPSGEVTNLPYLDEIARTGKPVILSSGMSSWEELDEAVNTVTRHHDQLSILQCTSEYPVPYEQVGLNVMVEMKARYGFPVGLSDHTLTPFAAYAAVTMGATIIEKHLTFSRQMYGSDARTALEPAEFKTMVEGIRAIETMLANPVDKAQVERYQTMKETFEKSLVAAVDIPAGAVLTAEMIAFKKPGTGLPPKALPDVIGKVARRALPADSLLTLQDIEG